MPGAFHSEKYICPLIPKGIWFAVPVRAGEKTCRKT
ncbi:MAG: hypothetical protein KAY32_01965 [Candidatus Eisenbacteria sp.]|nr:hypothetical protein [Candidatus Eisenbacteria bacterium]